MLARANLPVEYEMWNRRWGSPHGKAALLPRLRSDKLRGVTARLAAMICGPFAWQANSPVRAFEYPWAAAQVAPRSRLLEIGGALSGLQFVLAKDKLCEVHNVDPFFDYGNGPEEYASSPDARHAELNRAYGTDVALHHSTLEEADLTGAFDTVVCVSTIEHMSLASLESTLDRIDELLRSGGRLILTVDLFLDVAPFCSAERNSWGTNIPPAMIADRTGYRLTVGEPSELFGFPGFSTDSVLCNLWSYMSYRGGLAQCLVLQKP